MTIEQTMDYDTFKFRPDNRAKIIKSHVDELAEAIQKNNLLHLHPIIVNSDLEIMSGQHRLLAAKKLGVPIYYIMDDSLKDTDMMALNNGKNWGMIDVLNLYCQQGNENYLKLRDFWKENDLNFKIALSVCIGRSLLKFKDFKNGLFIFDEKKADLAVDICKETKQLIGESKGYMLTSYTHSAKFWKAITLIANHPDFSKDKWMKNLAALMPKVGPRTSEIDYVNMFLDIYNWKNQCKINKSEFSDG